MEKADAKRKVLEGGTHIMRQFESRIQGCQGTKPSCETEKGVCGFTSFASIFHLPHCNKIEPVLCLVLLWCEGSRRNNNILFQYTVFYQDKLSAQYGEGSKT